MRASGRRRPPLACSPLRECRRHALLPRKLGRARARAWSRCRCPGSPARACGARVQRSLACSRPGRRERGRAGRRTACGACRASARACDPRTACARCRRAERPACARRPRERRWLDRLRATRRPSGPPRPRHSPARAAPAGGGARAAPDARRPRSGARRGSITPSSPGPLVAASNVRGCRRPP